MEAIPEVDSIYTEYHPSSGRLPEVKPLHKHNYKRYPKATPVAHPWMPFKTRLDFEVLEFAMELGFNNQQLKTYISLFHRVISAAGNTEERFTVRNSKEANNLWALASVRRVGVSINKMFYYYFTTYSLFQYRPVSKGHD
jgi:hypothetical protein